MMRMKLLDYTTDPAAIFERHENDVDIVIAAGHLEIMFRLRYWIALLVDIEVVREGSWRY